MEPDARCPECGGPVSRGADPGCVLCEWTPTYEPDEDRDDCRSINEMHREAHEMDRWTNDPRW